MSAKRLIARSARPAVRRRLSGLVEVAPAPVPPLVPSVTPMETTLQPAHEEVALGAAPTPVTAHAPAPATSLSAGPSMLSPVAGHAAPDTEVEAPTHGNRPRPLPPPPAAARSTAAPAAHDLAPPPGPQEGPYASVADSPVPRLRAEPLAERRGVPVEAAEPADVVVAPAAVATPPPPRPAPHAAAAPTPLPVAPASPPVMIERIEIVTPPARPAPADPLAPLAGRRAARSRHGVAR